MQVLCTTWYIQVKHVKILVTFVPLINCGEVEDVVGALTSVVGGVAHVFHGLLVELRLLLVAEVEEGEEEDRQEEGWEVERRRSSQRETTTHMYGMEMGVTRRKEVEPM